MTVQPDLFGTEPALVLEEPARVYVPAPRADPVPGTPNLFVHLRPRYDGDPTESPGELPPWGAYRFDQAARRRQLARWLSVGASYRGFVGWCGHVVVLSVDEWRQDTQRWACRYRDCAGWVQRDSQGIDVQRTDQCPVCGGGCGEGACEADMEGDE